MRNLLHYLAGFLMMFTIAYLGEFHNYTPTSKAVGAPLLGLVLGLILGFSWELYQIARKQTEKIGWDDVVRTMIGGLIGVLLGTYLLY